MIFVTVGTHQQPFTRLIRALDALPSAELVVQHGFAEAPHGVARAVRFMPFPEMLENFQRADTVITHAGVGSILCATNVGHVPIVVPRLKRHREHVDDHQLELMHALQDAGGVRVILDVGLLARAVAEAPPRRAPVERRPGPLHESVKLAILGNPEPTAGNRTRAGVGIDR